MKPQPPLPPFLAAKSLAKSSAFGQDFRNKGSTWATQAALNSARGRFPWALERLRMNRRNFEEEQLKLLLDLRTGNLDNLVLLLKDSVEVPQYSHSFLHLAQM